MKFVIVEASRLAKSFTESCSTLSVDQARMVDIRAAGVVARQVTIKAEWDRDSHLTLFGGARTARLRILLERLLRRGYCGSIMVEQLPSPPEVLVAAAEGRPSQSVSIV